MSPGLDEVMKKREEYQASKPQFTGSGTDLWMKNDDVVIAHSLFSGAEGDPYLEYYIAHEYAATTQGGRATLVYCPVLSDHDLNYNCQGCKEDIKTKDRFAMWFWVYRILHKQLNQGETLPTEKWIDDNTYFVRQIDGVKLWDTSAWKESPLNNIYMLAKQLGDLRKTRITLRRVVTDPRAKVPDLSVRYQFLPEMGSPGLSADIYNEAIKEIKPVREILMEKIKTQPTVQAPQQAASVVADGPAIAPFKAPESAAPAAPDVSQQPSDTLPPFTPPAKTDESLF